MLRFESPVVQTGRITTTELTIGECPVKRGESVLASLAAANRDPAAYPEPDRFDITWENIQHHRSAAAFTTASAPRPTSRDA